MTPYDTTVLQQVERMLAQAGAVLGLRLCYHDHTWRMPPRAWHAHHTAWCLAAKAADEGRCFRFEWDEVPRRLADAEGCGRVHRCPAGYTEIAAPVFMEGVLVGVLFAGTCWQDAGTPPFPGLIQSPDDAWLAARASLLGGVALKVARQLRAGNGDGDNRRTAILRYLTDHLDCRVTVRELADSLHLSPSRAAHVVTELFGMPLAALAHTVKLRRAADLLATTDIAVTEIALHCGYASPSYFAACFRRRYGIAPGVYRQRRPRQV
ncbi:MAG TPA: helix-turn-helix domain-containing protein [Armatimonadota bacterium]|nr:helix-turn-helix domain-containing protein [Armatimonadota bacterium]HOS42864.1 helix-turn-helix domain-containing protein [Armatimonadota bacterium]